MQAKAGTPTPTSPRQQSCVSPANYSKIAAATEATLTQAQRVMQELHSFSQARRAEVIGPHVCKDAGLSVLFAAVSVSIHQSSKSSR